MQDIPNRICSHLLQDPIFLKLTLFSILLTCDIFKEVVPQLFEALRRKMRGSGFDSKEGLIPSVRVQ